MGTLSMRGSIFSIASRMTQKQEEDIEYDAMTFEELQEMQNDVLQKIWMLTSENDIYERYITRMDPQVMKGITQLLERTKHTRRITRLMSMRSSRMSFRDSIMTIPDILKRKTITSYPSTPSIISVISGSRMATPSVFPTWNPTDSSKITIAHRITMANKEVDQMMKNLNELKTTVKKRSANIRAEVEELEIRIREVREAQEEFEENVVIGSVGVITGKIPAERVTRFIEEWLRSANVIIGRLRLKSATLRTLIKKSRHQLVQTAELGKALCAVDFEQLNIQNKDYVRMIEEKTIYVLDMKRIAGHYHLKLTQHKQKLSDLLCALNDLKKETWQRKKQIEELRAENKHVERDVAQTDKELSSLLNYMELHTAPDILDFVYLQEEVQELQKKYKLLNRRKNIERIMFRTSQKQAQPRQSVFAAELAKDRKFSGTIFPVAPLNIFL